MHINVNAFQQHASTNNPARATSRAARPPQPQQRKPRPRTYHTDRPAVRGDTAQTDLGSEVSSCPCTSRSIAAVASFGTAGLRDAQSVDERVDSPT
jgi:hypothetical protein